MVTSFARREAMLQQSAIQSERVVGQSKIEDAARLEGSMKSPKR